MVANLVCSKLLTTFSMSKHESSRAITNMELFESRYSTSQWLPWQQSPRGHWHPALHARAAVHLNPIPHFRGLKIVQEKLNSMLHMSHKGWSSIYARTGPGLDAYLSCIMRIFVIICSHSASVGDFKLWRCDNTSSWGSSSWSSWVSCGICCIRWRTSSSVVVWLRAFGLFLGNHLVSFRNGWACEFRPLVASAAACCFWWRWSCESGDWCAPLSQPSSLQANLCMLHLQGPRPPSLSRWFLTWNWDCQQNIQQPRSCRRHNLLWLQRSILLRWKSWWGCYWSPANFTSNDGIITLNLSFFSASQVYIN